MRANYKETIKSKLVAYYQNNGINNGKTIIIANNTLPKSPGGNINGVNVYKYLINNVTANNTISRIASI
jgi:hypothetical protein